MRAGSESWPPRTREEGTGEGASEREDLITFGVRWPWIVFAFALLLGVLTVFWHQQSTGPISGEMERHRATLEHRTPTPWRYRLLTTWINEGILRGTEALRVPRHEAVSLLGVRIAQNTAILWAAYTLYSLLGLGRRASLVALLLVAWVFSHSNYFSGLAHNTYTDILAYLIGAILVIRGRLGWLIPLTLVATLNRETCGFIPLLGLWRPLAQRRVGWAENRQAYMTAFFGVMVWAATYAFIRMVLVPSNPDLESYERAWKPAAPVGWRLLLYHATHINTLYHVTEAVSVLPLLAVLFFRKAPAILQAWCVMLVPVWFIGMSAVAFVAEARLLAVPVVLVLIPMAMCGIEGQPAAPPRLAQEVESPRAAG